MISSLLNPVRLGALACAAAALILSVPNASAGIAKGPKAYNVTDEQQYNQAVEEAKASLSQKRQVGMDRYLERQARRSHFIAAMQVELARRQQTVVITPASSDDTNDAVATQTSGMFWGIIALTIAAVGVMFFWFRPQKSGESAPRRLSGLGIPASIQTSFAKKALAGKVWTLE